MTHKKYMSSRERRIFKEKVIREYKLKHEKNKNYNNSTVKLLNLVRKLTPLNIALGIIAALILIYLEGWTEFIKTILTAIVWITIVATFLAALSKRG